MHQAPFQSFLVLSQDPGLLSEEGGFRSDEDRVSLVGSGGPADATVGLHVGKEVEAKGSRDSGLSSLLVLEMTLSEHWGAGQDGLVITIRGVGVPLSFLLILIMITLSRARKQTFWSLFLTTFYNLIDTHKKEFHCSFNLYLFDHSKSERFFLFSYLYFFFVNEFFSLLMSYLWTLP